MAKETAAFNQRIQRLLTIVLVDCQPQEEDVLVVLEEVGDALAGDFDEVGDFVHA